MGTPLDEIVICPMVEADMDEVLAIETASYPRPWLREHFQAELISPHAFPLTAFSADGRVAGYICPVLVLDEGHIMNVAVHPAFRGRGIGQLLVERIIADCRDAGAAFVSLEVRISNEAAIGLYQRLGFVGTGTRRRYYENGEDALLMEYIFAQHGDNHAV